MPFIMGLAYKQFRTRANQLLVTEFDLTLEMLGVLRTLHHLGEVPQQALSEALYRERSVIKRLVDNCIKRELVIAGKKAANQKARYISLTSKGLDTKTAADGRLQQVISEFFSPLLPDEQEQLLSLCKKLVQNGVTTEF